jgi:hypothetical protein
MGLGFADPGHRHRFLKYHEQWVCQEKGATSILSNCIIRTILFAESL